MVLAIYNSKQDISRNIISENTGDLSKLVFEVTGDDWYISNVSLRNNKIHHSHQMNLQSYKIYQEKLQQKHSILDLSFMM